MITVNSLSGGKTSSYLAAHYPADLELFSLVCIDDHNANAGSTSFKVDKHVRQLVNDKLQKFCSDQHEFLATAEDPLIIKTMFDLEQHLGREIIWLRGPGFQQMTFGKSMLPNKKHRFCTTIFKIEPIFRHLFRYHTLPCKMRIGYRSDEATREESFTDTWKYSTHAELALPGDKVPGNYHIKPLPYITKTGKINPDYSRGNSLPHMHRWEEVIWRVGEFPLIEDGIIQNDIQRYWADKDIQFPVDSNCQFCFWKNEQQLRRNFDTQPGTMNAAVVVEDMLGSNLLKSMSLMKVRDIAPQMDLFQSTGSSCHGGFCTS